MSKSCCPNKHAPAVLPTLPKQIAELARTAAAAFSNFAKTGQVAAKPDVIEARLAKCKGCDKFTGTRCIACGCFVHLKVVAEVSTCPVGKW